MKIAFVHKNIIFSLFLLLLGTATASAQRDHDGWRVGVDIGYMNYFGDVSPYQIKKWNEWDHVFRFFQYNKYYTPEVSYGITLERKLTPGMGLLLQVSEGKISMSDRYRKPDGDYDVNAPDWDRALNFQTTIQDAGISLVFRSDNGRLLPADAFLSPYLSLGAGITRFRVKGDLYDKNGNPYNYADPGVHPDGVYETALRPLETETSGEYPDVAPYVDLGAGIQFRLGGRVNLSVSTDIKYSFSDYLDDVKGKYKTHYTSAEQAYAAHPGTNVIDPATMNRGNNDGVSDFYIFNKITFQYSFGRKKNRRFTAPIVYEPGNLLYKTIADTADVSPDSLGRSSDLPENLQTSDSLRNKPADTLSVTRKPGNEIENELREIKGELVSLRFTHIDAGYIIRRDVVQNEIGRLILKRRDLQNRSNGTRENKLRIRLYDLQIDSLYNELSAIRRARLQLRRDMADAPVITEYRDSTKIMIYKDHAGRDSAHMPVIQGKHEPVRTDISSSEVPENASAAAKETMVKGAVQSEKSPGGRPLTPADSIRYQLAILQQQAAEREDTIYYRRLQQVADRLDSLERSPREDSLQVVKRRLEYAQNRTRIMQDSLQAVYLSQQADSLRAINEPPKRNGLQKFFDKFKSKKKRRGEDTLNERQDSGFRDTSNAAPEQVMYEDINRDDNTATLLKSNQEEIARLNDEIGRLRRANEADARRQPQIIYEDNSDSRDLRRDRRAMQNLTREMARSNRLGRRNNPTVTPNIILGAPVQNDKSELKDIRDQLAQLKQQYQAGEDSEVVRLRDQVDSLRNRQDEVSAAARTQAEIIPLQSRIDSLEHQLSLVRRSRVDSAEKKPASAGKFNISGFPVVSVYFSTGSYQLKTGEKNKIRPVAEMARQYPGITLLIKGHTDATGNARINQVLAEKRCNTVKDILTGEYGVDINRIKTEAVAASGKGGGNPLQRRVDLQFEN